MAGSPKKRQLKLDLEQRTRSEFPDDPEATHLDYVARWQADGRLLRDLCAELDVSTGLLQDYLRSTFGAEQVRETLARAREAGAHQLAEEVVEKADAATDKDDVPAARLQVDARKWLAEKWNRREFGTDKGTTVNLSIGSLMLEALQAPVPARPVIASVIAEDAEVVSIEPATSSNGE